MKASEFRAWMEAFDHLSCGQKDKLGQRLQAESGKNREVGLIDQSSTEPTSCPHCGSIEKPLHWGTSYNLPRYRCRSCKRTFTALTSTPLAGLYINGKGNAKLLNYEQVIAQGLLSKSKGGVAILCGDNIICSHPYYPVKRFALLTE